MSAQKLPAGSSTTWVSMTKLPDKPKTTIHYNQHPPLGSEVIKKMAVWWMNLCSADARRPTAFVEEE